jgi:hypothetical protein
MKTSNKVLTLYTLITPLIIVLGFIITHDFSVISKLRVLYKNPDTWTHISENLPEEPFSVISSNFASIYFSDTVAKGTIGYRYVDERLKPAYYVKNDTLFIWSLFSPGNALYTAYFFLHPVDTMNLVGKFANIKGDFSKVDELRTNFNSSSLKMESGYLNKVVADHLSHSVLYIAADTLIGNPIRSTIITNESLVYIGNLDQESRMTFSVDPIQALNDGKTFLDNSWGVMNFYINRVVNFNLTDSTFQAQVPPQ